MNVPPTSIPRTLTSAVDARRERELDGGVDTELLTLAARLFVRNLAERLRHRSCRSVAEVALERRRR